jgi:predicted branched-subunit amino acid permease
MDGSGSQPLLGAAWPADTTRRAAAWRGARETAILPAAILFATFLGFGTLTNQTGFTWLHTIVMSAFIFALPGQVVLVDEMIRGASLFTAALAVTATGVRLLPMTVALLPMVRDPRVPKWMEFALAYFVAVTVWIESLRRGPDVPRHLRAAYMLGIAALLVSASLGGVTAGYLIANQVPSLIAAALLFVTPLYFLLGMLGSSRTAANLLPIATGLVLGPLFHLLWPSFDLLLTGLVGGTASFLITRYALPRWRARP